jgi:hypothetical protein
MIFKESAMTDHHEETASRIVDAFKASIDESTRENISTAQYDVLVAAIREALSSERATIADQIEGVVKKLRTDVDKLEIEL